MKLHGNGSAPPAAGGAAGAPEGGAEGGIWIRSSVSPRPAWRSHAGWQPRHAAWRTLSRPAPKTVLAAIPAELKPHLDRAIRAAVEARRADGGAPMAKGGARGGNDDAIAATPATPQQLPPMTAPSLKGGANGELGSRGSLPTPPASKRLAIAKALVPISPQASPRVHKLQGCISGSVDGSLDPRA